MPDFATSQNELTEKDVEGLRRRLLGMRAELEARRSERDILQLKRVEAALAKMTRGGYGNCDSCARPMLRNRVLETPHVRYCAVCSGGRNSAPPRGRAGGSRGPARGAAPAARA